MGCCAGCCERDDDKVEGDRASERCWWRLFAVVSLVVSILITLGVLIVRDEDKFEDLQDFHFATIILNWFTFSLISLVTFLKNELFLR